MLIKSKRMCIFIHVQVTLDVIGHGKEENGMKKRMLSILLAAVCVFALAACGGDGGSSDDAKGDGKDDAKYVSSVLLKS